MIYPTHHGDLIASQIQGEDAFGISGTLNLADVWTILDNLHTHFLDTGQDNAFLEKWMMELRDMEDIRV